MCRKGTCRSCHAERTREKLYGPRPTPPRHALVVPPPPAAQPEPTAAMLAWLLWAVMAWVPRRERISR